MNNEPVAWMVEDDEDISFIMNGNGFAKPDASWKSVIPVYTHPVKELTNAEILWLADEYSDNENLVADCVGFARAILRKAQEK
jgi:hypothetical protein